MAYTDIDDPTIYFDTTLYTGNGSSQTLTMDNIGLLWMKRRDSSIRHCLFDSVRGGHYTGSGNAPLLVSDSSAAAQGTDIDSAAKGITFGATQTVIGNDAAGYSYNVSGHSMVGWQWSAGGSASSNSDGSITTTVSVNQTAGFSIMKYAGNSTNSTIGHGLNAEPEYIIFKEIDGGESWRVWSKYTPNTSSNALALNLTNGAFSQSGWISAVSSSTISIGTDSSINTNGNNYIAYAFAPKKAFSRFGSYVGNGSNDGSYIHLGFSPSFVMLKRTNTTGSWTIYDNKRYTYNPNGEYLLANNTGGGIAFANLDFLSNGFKLRDASFNNGSGDTIIYMAFASSPFTTSTGIPTTAR